MYNISTDEYTFHVYFTFPLCFLKQSYHCTAIENRRVHWNQEEFFSAHSNHEQERIYIWLYRCRHTFYEFCPTFFFWMKSRMCCTTHSVMFHIRKTFFFSCLWEKFRQFLTGTYWNNTEIQWMRCTDTYTIQMRTPFFEIVPSKKDIYCERPYT